MPESASTSGLDRDVWPSLPFAEWRDTYATLHMWTQVVGKVCLALMPPANHFWNIAFHISARGLVTPVVLLAFTFLVGAFGALTAPASHAVTPQLVPAHVARVAPDFIGLEFEHAGLIERDLLIRKLFTAGQNTASDTASTWQVTLGLLLTCSLSLAVLVLGMMSTLVRSQKG